MPNGDDGAVNRKSKRNRSRPRKRGPYRVRNRRNRTAVQQPIAQVVADKRAGKATINFWLP